MNIIHLVRAVTWGGGERYALDLCRASVEAGHNVVVATKGTSLIDSKFSEAGAVIEHLPLGGTLDCLSPIRLARLIRSLPGDEVVIHVHTFKDAEIAARAKVLLNSGSKEKNGKAPKRVRLVCTRHLVKPGKRSPRWNFIFRHIDALIFVSELAKRVFLEGDPKVAPDILSVIHNSIIPPAEELSPTGGTQSFSPSAAPQCIVLYTGRISPEKGIETLIKAIARIKECPLNLRIAGTGPEEYISSLKSLAEKEGVDKRIEWLGFVPDIFEEIRRSDICVAPSLWREPFGLTIIEFMSQGRPVVTTDNGAQPEIITDGIDGILIPAGDAASLAGAIRSLVENPSLRKEIGRKGADTFKRRFAYPIFFSKIISIYKDCLNF